MLTDYQIDQMLRNDHDLQYRLALDIGKFTVALLGLDKNAEAKESFAGTGTLVTLGGRHHILTASHVWHDVLKTSSKIGVTLPADITHSFKMETSSIESVADLRPAAGGNEWGPDLILLRVPSEYISEISAHRVFYDKDVDGKPAPPGSGGCEVRILKGTPAELATFEPKHADLNIVNFFSNVNAPFQTHNEYDFVDLDFDTALPGNPKDFGGVSGGGLWDLQVFCSPESGKPDWTRQLKGVAFWQKPPVGTIRTIRCHGPLSLDLLQKQIKQ
jgi:hypothetical protein